MIANVSQRCHHISHNTTMSHPTTPSEAVPAYEHVFNREHPVNANPPSGSASGYAAVPQDEPDSEPAHNHSAPSISFMRHQHCETCDTLTTAREIRANERHYCLWPRVPRFDQSRVSPCHVAVLWAHVVVPMLSHFVWPSHSKLFSLRPCTCSQQWCPPSARPGGSAH